LTVGTEFDPVSATDNCGAVTVSNNINAGSTLAGHIFPAGLNTVIWKATDACGNTATCSFIVKINKLPVAVLDNTTTTEDTPVSGNAATNDTPGDGANTWTLISVNGGAANGTVFMNTDGTYTYTPNTNFYGVDIINYRVCDVDIDCATSIIVVTVTPANDCPVANNVSATYPNPGGTNKVLAPTLNGSDPEDGLISIGGTMKILTLPASGTLYYGLVPAAVIAGQVISSYDPTLLTFDPVDGVSTNTFTYQVIDNGSLLSCNTATATITITNSPDLKTSITLSPNNIIGPTALEIIVSVSELKNVNTDGSDIVIYVDKLAMFGNFAFNSAQTISSVGAVQNSLFTVDNSDPDFYIIKASSLVFKNQTRRLVFTVTADPGATKGNSAVNAYLLDGSGGETIFTNNSSITKLVFSY